MSSFRAFMPSRQTKSSSQAWPLFCLDGINPFGSFIPQEQKQQKPYTKNIFQQDGTLVSEGLCFSCFSFASNLADRLLWR